MKKVCFVADRFFWEEEMGDLLYQEINKISNEDRVVEFYFQFVFFSVGGDTVYKYILGSM